MANTLGRLFGDIADAIREKSGETEKISPAEFPEKIRSIEGGSCADVRYVIFLSHDGTVEYGRKPVAVGDDCADPIARGLFATPVREGNAQYTYTFAGWSTAPGGGLTDDAFKSVTEDRMLYANFIAALRYYTVTYYDGSTVLKTESLPYGAMPSYAPAKTGYTFNGWVPEAEVVTGDADYTAKWLEKLDFNALSWAQIAEYAKQDDVDRLFDLGATKTFTLNSKNTPVTARIIGFKHDDLADGSGKAGITLMLEGFMNGYDSMHGAGNATQKATTWRDMTTREYLQKYYFSSYLPADLRAAIKTVKKTTWNLSASVYDDTDDTAFIPSASEVCSWAGMYGYKSEGACYQYYAQGDTAARIIKYNDVAVPWWTRTKANATTGILARVNAEGSLSTANQSNVSNGGYPFACVCL